MTIKGEDGEPLPMPTDVRGGHPPLIAETADISGGGEPALMGGYAWEPGMPIPDPPGHGYWEAGDY